MQNISEKASVITLDLVQVTTNATLLNELPVNTYVTVLIFNIILVTSGCVGNILSFAVLLKKKV